MNLFTKIVISVLVGSATWAAYKLLPALPLPMAFCIATVATTLVLSLLPGNGAAAADEQAQPAVSRTDASSGGAREEGQVKWFNVSKGFGFIIRDNGEEIFVHFRSIRGDDRRGLRDGQRVAFVVAQSDKGPQAEDVEPL